MHDSLMFVQFPHPGAEHKPQDLSMDWNTGAHARKFLKADGAYISNGGARLGEFAFWGEWEPQSKIIDTYPRLAPGLPRWLHEPYWEVPRHRRLLQNTDPLVFGDQFMYSNCRQGRNTKLRHLAPGSLIVFGSKLGRDFVIDTVFVVAAGAQDFTRASAAKLAVGDWVHSVVFDPLRMSSRAPNDSFRLYRGVSFADTGSGPYSFVPCLPLEADDGAFPRPALHLDRRRLNPNLAMGAKATPATAGELHDLWKDIVSQVIAAGLALGVRLDPPPRQRASSPDGRAVRFG